MAEVLRLLGRRAPFLASLFLLAACGGAVDSGKDEGDGGGRDGQTGDLTDAGPNESPAQDAAPPEGGTEMPDASHDSDATPPPGIPANANLLPWLPGVTFHVTQGNGMGSHTGQFTFSWDFDLPVGTTVVASHDGVVRFVKADSRVGGCDPMYFNDGNFVILEKEPGVSSVYGHLDTAIVAVGQRVKRGEVIGTSGETGYVCGAHLHFHFQDDAGATVEQEFYDTGEAWNPPRGATVTSANAIAP